MNEILLNILSIVLMTVILPLLSYGVTRLITYLNSKIKDEKAKKLIIQATEIVTNAVKTVFQTYVDSLKKSGNFNKDSQLEALEKAKDIALSQLNEDIKEYITKNYGDINIWLTTQIEATIDSLKNTKTLK